MRCISLKKKLIFSFPKKKEILLYINSHDCIKNKESFFHETLDRNTYEVVDQNLYFINFWILLLTFLKFNFSSMSYKCTMIKWVRPKFFITNVDNDVSFYKLKPLFPNIIFVAIQNGWRGKTNDIFGSHDFKNDPLHCDYIFVFNEDVSDTYRKFFNTKTIVSGSMIANTLKLFDPVIKKKKISFLLQFRTRKYYPFRSKPKKNNKNYLWDDLFLNTSIILKYLGEYCHLNNIELNVIGRSRHGHEQIEENNFIKEYIHHDFKYIPRVNKYSSYNATADSKVVVSINSTLTFELMALGKRVVNINTRSKIYQDIEDSFGYPAIKVREGCFWTESLDKEKIFNLINFAINSTEIEWKEKAGCYTSKLMKYDYKNTLFKNFLKKYEK